MVFVLVTSVSIALGAQEGREVKGELGERLDSVAQASVGFGFSGAVLVGRGGEVVLLSGYGLCDRESNAPCGTATLFDLASVTKQFTAVLVMQLVDEGVLALDDNIARWLPEAPEELSGITIDHLLTHTAGFSRYGASGFGEDLSRAVRVYLMAKPEREPGLEFEYHNGGYALLAAIVERASGVDYRERMRKSIFAPAGMSHAGFCRDPDLDLDNVADGHEGEQSIGKGSEHTFGWEYRGMGGLLASVEDLWKWDRALAEGKLLSATMMQKMHEPRLGGYARGVRVGRTARGTKLVHHNGTVMGFESEVRRFVDEDAVVCVLANMRGAARPLADMLAALLFDEPPRMALPPPTVNLDEAARAAIVGVYRDDAWRRVTIESVDDGSFLWRGEIAPDARALDRGELAALGRDKLQAIVIGRRAIEGLAERDAGPLAAALAAGVPPDWAETTVKKQLWTRHLLAHGKLENIAVLCAQQVGKRLMVDYLLEHERGRAVCHVEMIDSKIAVFDLAGGLGSGTSRALVAAAMKEGGFELVMGDLGDREFKVARFAAADGAGAKNGACPEVVLEYAQRRIRFVRE